MAKITSQNSGAPFEWNDPIAMALAEELTPLLIEMPAEERIAAMAYQIAAAAWETGHPFHHECLDAVKADLMGQLVTRLCVIGFQAQRKLEAELQGGGAGGEDDLNEVCDDN
jgi:hypothetical protein